MAKNMMGSTADSRLALDFSDGGGEFVRSVICSSRQLHRRIAKPRRERGLALNQPQAATYARVRIYCSASSALHTSIASAGDRVGFR